MAGRRGARIAFLLVWVVAAAAASFAAAAGAEAPGAFELMQRARDAHAARGIAIELPEPEAAAVEAEEACGARRCWRVVGTLAGGREVRLWIDRESFLVVRAEGIAVPPLPPTSTSPPAAAADLPPPGAPKVVERIEVALESVVARVLDPDGTPIVGLGAADFRLIAGPHDLPIEGVEWVGREAPAAVDASPSNAAEATELAASQPPVALAPPPPGKLVLFFVQSDFHDSRLSGHVRMSGRAVELIDTFADEDRAAVVSFDSRLKLRADFTRDRERLAEALQASIRTGPEPRIREQPEPSLRRHWKSREARDAATPERALEVAVRALVPLPGEKVVVFLGWGLGNLTPIGVRMPPAYDDALRALEAARASVFVLDVSDADFHSLEIGLKQVAADTGGTYSKTHLFPEAATRRLARALEGHYLLYYRRPADLPPDARLRVELVRRDLGEVVASR